MRLGAGNPLERELRRPMPFVRIDAQGNARMSWSGYLVCAAAAALLALAGWWALPLLG